MKKIFFLLAVLVSGCGATDPLQLTDNTIPPLNAFMTQGTYGAAPTTFTAVQPFWTYVANTFTGFAFAPAKGIVSDTGVSALNGSLGSFVSILHSGRLSTRIYGLSTVSVRPGDFVLSGQSIGQFYAGSPISFQVILDQTPVCPLSYMSQSFRLNFTTFGTTPCF